MTKAANIFIFDKTSEHSCMVQFISTFEKGFNVEYRVQVIVNNDNRHQYAFPKIRRNKNTNQLYITCRAEGQLRSFMLPDSVLETLLLNRLKGDLEPFMSPLAHIMQEGRP
jgi:hypothetical protein